MEYFSPKRTKYEWNEARQPYEIDYTTIVEIGNNQTIKIPIKILTKEYKKENINIPSLIKQVEIEPNYLWTEKDWVEWAKCESL